MNLIISEAEAKRIILEHLGLENKLITHPSGLQILQTPHDITIIPEPAPTEDFPCLGSPSVGDPNANKPQTVSDEAYQVGYPSDEAIGEIEDEL